MCPGCECGLPHRKNRWVWPITSAQQALTGLQCGDPQAMASTCMAQGTLQGACMPSGFQGKALVGAPMAAGEACTDWALWGGQMGWLGPFWRRG